MDRIHFKLYVAGRATPRSQRAIANLRRLCGADLEGRCEVEVVDVVEDPAAAETARILMTPTLVKEAPAPARRVTGDLSDSDKVLYGLALEPGLFLPPDREQHG